MDSTRVLLVRHGQSEGNAEGRFGGHTATPLSARGRRQAEATARALFEEKVTAVYFDKNLRVERVALYGLQDGRVFDFLSRTTPTGGEDLSFLGQIFKGDTTFNPL